MRNFRITEYDVKKNCFGKEIKLALVCDLHSDTRTQIEHVIEALEKNAPDYVLMAGDIFEKLDGSCPDGKAAGFELIRRASAIAPVLMSVGNHENGGTGSWNKIKWMRIKSLPKELDMGELDKILDCGATLLDDTYVIKDGIAFGGLSSGLINEKRLPDTEWLDGFCSLDYPKILLCHHPEYYEKYLKDKNIDIIVSGHAHGGQWRIFGRGVFAPGQGIFPKYTSGLHDERLIISRGLKRSGKIPRIFNPTEVVFINVN